MADDVIGVELKGCLAQRALKTNHVDQVHVGSVRGKHEVVCERVGDGGSWVVHDQCASDGAWWSSGVAIGLAPVGDGGRLPCAC